MKIFIQSFVLIFLLIVNNLLSQKGEDILPVELIYFEAHLTYSGVLLRWGTATEVNNFGFEVQRADSTYQFMGIGFVQGSGTSNSPKHYFYFDSTLTDYGMYHYRLRQIDIDGYYRYSDTVHIFFQPTGVKENLTKSPVKINFYNNRLTKELIITTSGLDEFDEVYASIYNVLGEKLKSVSNSVGSFQINYSSIPNGVYIISVHSNKNILATHKFIVIQ